MLPRQREHLQHAGPAQPERPAQRARPAGPAYRAVTSIRLYSPWPVRVQGNPAYADFIENGVKLVKLKQSVNGTVSNRIDCSPDKVYADRHETHKIAALPGGPFYTRVCRIVPPKAGLTIRPVVIP